jgi:NADPH-dependent curcumin reductase CurA
METNEGVVLRRRPTGLLREDDVELVELPMPRPRPGELVVRTEWLGIDATVRSWLDSGEGYFPAVEIGDVVRCSGIGTVVESQGDRFAPGHRAIGLPGWQRYALLPDTVGLVTPLPADADPEATMAVLGATGLTAYLGIVEVGAARAGETVVVSAAAGATGSLAAQIAKIQGCRVIGVAGSDEKCRWLVDDLGLDGAVNHRTADVTAELRRLCPDRIDVYFDNVGGPVLDACLARLAHHGRVVLCGAISGYNEPHRPPGPANYVNLIQRRGRMEGFLSLDHWDRMPEIAEILTGWLGDGRLTFRTQRYDGLAAAVDALNALFTGANTGKVVIKL